MLLTLLVLTIASTGLAIRPDNSIHYSRMGIVIVFYTTISAYTNYYIHNLGTGYSLYSDLFNITSIGLTFQIFILIISGLILILTGFYPRKRFISIAPSLITALSTKVKEYKTIINKSGGHFAIVEYGLILLFVVSGATLLLCCSDMGSIYICIELQSFSLYIISAIHRDSESSTGSALTYFLLGGLSSCFILLGIALIYANSGITNMEDLYSIVADSDKYVYYSSWYVHNYIFYSLLLISVGLLFKIAAAPFHWWSPDVYDGVPTVVTVFIAILGKIAILILLLQLVNYTSSLLYSTVQFYSWTISLSISCLMSLIIGTILGLSQTRIKRLLAYSTISHIGFILMALIIHSIESYQAFFFYLIQYIISNLNVFFILIAMGYSLYLYYSDDEEYASLTEKDYSPIQLISQLKGFFTINPALALCLVITMFSFVGLPPLVGFFAKQMVLTVALDNNKIILVLIGILTSVIGAVYYLTVIKTVYFEESHYKKPKGYVKISISNPYSVTISILNILTVMFIFIPDEILNICNLLSLNNFIVENDAPEPWGLFFQDSATSQIKV